MSTMRLANAQNQEGQPQLHAATFRRRIVRAWHCVTLPLPDRDRYRRIRDAWGRANGLFKVKSMEVF